MKLIVISNPINVNNEHTLLCSLFESGLEYFHLRKPDFSLDELEAYIQQIPKQYHHKIVLHSHHQLAIEYGLKGVHYTNKNPYQGPDTFPKGMQLSTSFHSLEEIKNASSAFQYVFISPVFDSISKEGYHSNFDKTDLKQFLANKKSSMEIIALGGINEQTITEAMEIGFDGIAVLGAIWLSKNALETFKQLLAITIEFNKTKNSIHA